MAPRTFPLWFVSLLLTIAFSILFFVPLGLAEERPAPSYEYTWKPPKQPPPKWSERWEIAPEIFWFSYEEPSLSVKTDGFLYGVRGSWTEPGVKTPLMGRLEGFYAIGTVDYDGSLSDGTPHTTSGTDWIFDGRGLIGYPWMLGKNVTTLFAGLGFRSLFDDLESANAYRREIRYLYSPIGIESRYPVSENWTFGLRAEYDLFWRGWVTSHLSDVNVLFGDVDNRQDTGYGVRGSVYFRRMTGKKTAVSIEPFIRYWNIEESDLSALTFAGALVGSGQEPGNKTIESGLQISFLF